MKNRCKVVNTLKFTYQVWYSILMILSLYDANTIIAWSLKNPFMLWIIFYCVNIQNWLQMIYISLLSHWPKVDEQVSMLDVLQHKQQWFLHGTATNHVHDKLAQLIACAWHLLHHLYLLQEIGLDGASCIFYSNDYMHNYKYA